LSLSLSREEEIESKSAVKISPGNTQEPFSRPLFCKKSRFAISRIKPSCFADIHSFDAPSAIY